MLTREQILELFERSKDDRAIIVGSEVRQLADMALRSLSEREAVIEAVNDEPELPEPMPDEMWEAIRNDRDAAQQAFRIAIQLAKIGIIDRIRALSPKAAK